MSCDKKSPRNISHVLEAEKEAIHKARNKLNSNCPDSPNAGNPKNLFGIALSGGGIRSATFNLGLLQALAEKKLLRKVDYLSTVSGGGFIGAWLSSLIRNRSKCKGIEEVEKDIADKTTSASKETDESILHLREYSNYLTPNNSALSLDWWGAIAILFRNLILNQLQLISLIAALLLVPFCLTSLFYDQNFCYASLITTLSLLVASTSVSHGLQKIDDDKPSSYSEMRIFLQIALPSFVASIVMAGVIFNMSSDLYQNKAVCWLSLGVVGYFLLWVVGYALAKTWYFIVPLPKAPITELRCKECPDTKITKDKSAHGLSFYFDMCMKFVLSKLIPSFLAGAVIGLLFYVYAKLLFLIPDQHRIWLSLALGVPTIFSIICLGVIAHIGLAKRGFSELGREWLGRAGGQALLIILAWACLCLVAFYAPALVRYTNAYVEVIGGFWSVISAVGFWLAKSDKTGAKGSAKWADTLARIAPYIFIIGLVVLVSAGLHRGLMIYTDVIKCDDTANLSKNKPPEAFILKCQANLPKENCLIEWNEKSPPSVQKNFGKYADQMYCENKQINFSIQLGALVLFIGIIFLLGWRIDINLFSMQQFYRNRLTRCYLGATRSKRTYDKFTGFDDKDDLFLCVLEDQRPFHLINTTLNLSKIGDDEGAGRLDWQNRKGASFIFSPLFCGFSLSGKKDIHAYRKTYEYMNKEGLFEFPTCGPELGRAIAISGAAASPNMGYHTSTATSFLMTFFNIRLGRWCGNPNTEAFNYSTPAFGIRYLLQELFGSTDATTRYVNLSDGGHFENLGLYELVRRECKLIMVSDASCDPDYQFEDLANAITKCRIDLGAKIDIEVRNMKDSDENTKKKNGENIDSQRPRWVIGQITYKSGKKGMLIYIKPVLRKNNDPVDIQYYADTHPEFPHESTADQWFDETQFEAYRQLGLLTGEKMLEDNIFEIDEKLSIDEWIKQISQKLKQKLLFRAKCREIH